MQLTFGRGDVNLSAIAPGSIVWKTDDPALRRRLEKTYATDRPARREAISVWIEGRVGEPLRVRLTDAAGHSADVTGDAPLPAAIKHPLTVDLIREQFGRLGDTQFELGAIELHGDAGPAEMLPVMVPKSVLNDLRRRAVASLVESRGRTKRRSEVRTMALDELRTAVAAGLVPAIADAQSAVPATRAGATDRPTLTVLVRSVEQLDAVLAWSGDSARTASLDSGLSALDSVHADFEDVRLFRDAVAKCREARVAIGLATPRVVKPSEEGLLRQVANCRPDAVLVRNLAALTYFQEVRQTQRGLRLVGDYSLNVANEITASLFSEQGLTRMVPSYDLNMTQLQAMLGRIDPGLFEVVLHQHIPMFHMEHCVFSHVLSNGRDAHECGRPCDRHRVELRDHTGEAHPLVADVGCRNTVFRSEAQSAAAYVPRLVQLGVRHFRVEMLRESATEAAELLDSYRDVLAGKPSTRTSGRSLRVLTQIGVSAGTFDFA